VACILVCRVLRVSRSGYCDWKDRPLSKTARENAALTEKIKQIHDRSRQTYGFTQASMQSLERWECVTEGRQAPPSSTRLPSSLHKRAPYLPT
jgi:hypothetical protein